MVSVPTKWCEPLACSAVNSLAYRRYFAGTQTCMFRSAEAEIQAVLPLCTYLIRTDGKVQSLVLATACLAYRHTSVPKVVVYVKPGKAKSAILSTVAGCLRCHLPTTALPASVIRLHSCRQKARCTSGSSDSALQQPSQSHLPPGLARHRQE